MPKVTGEDALEKPATLEARNITRLYKGSGRGVTDISFEVHPGEIFGLMGPNGSGKSTLLRVLSTAIAPESRSYGIDKGKAEGVLAELFDYFGLAEYRDDKVKRYSYGMGKKLALVEALAHGPELLLLDEPSLGLDYASQLAYQKKIRELVASGVAVLVASNQVDEVEALCDRVAFLHRGGLAALGTPEGLVSSLKGTRRVVATLRNPVEYAALEGVPGVERVVPEGGDLVIHCEERPGIVADVVAGLVRAGGDIADLSVRRPSLADVYVKLTGEALNDDEA